MSSTENPTTAQLYQEEVQRKQSLRRIQYWYKGKPVQSGPFATTQTSSADPSSDRNR